jgi:hypothetical protein
MRRQAIPWGGTLWRHPLHGLSTLRGFGLYTKKQDLETLTLSQVAQLQGLEASLLLCKSVGLAPSLQKPNRLLEVTVLVSTFSLRLQKKKKKSHLS